MIIFAFALVEELVDLPSVLTRLDSQFSGVHTARDRLVKGLPVIVFSVARDGSFAALRIDTDRVL